MGLLYTSFVVKKSLLLLIILIILLVLNIFLASKLISSPVVIDNTSRHYIVEYRETKAFNQLLLDWGAYKKSKILRQKNSNLINNIKIVFTDAPHLLHTLYKSLT